MWTGARIEELCSLKVEETHLDAKVPYIDIKDAKTAAGVRQGQSIPSSSLRLRNPGSCVDWQRT
jgi:hypothetical protein